jgi:hypothetical protein
MRDAMLALSGQFDSSRPKGSPVARGGEGRPRQGLVPAAWARAASGPRGDSGGDTPHGLRPHRPRWAAGDAHRIRLPDPSLIIGERASTTIPAQSLYLMNNAFVIRQAEGFAEKLLAGEGDDKARLTRPTSLLAAALGQGADAARKFLADYGKKQTRRRLDRPCPGTVRRAEFSHR